MSNSNNRRSNNRGAGSKPRRPSEAVEKAQRAGAQNSAMKRASEEAADAADAVDDAEATDAVEEAASEAAEARTAPAKERSTRSRDAAEREPAKRRDAARRDSTPRLPDDDGTSTGRERPARRSTAGGSSTRSGSKPAAKSPAKQPAKSPAKSRRTRPAEPERRSTAARNGDAASSNGSRRSTSARRPDAAAEPAEGRTRRRSKPAESDSVERAERAERRSPVQRYEVSYGEADLAVRDRSLEALWYEIADQWGPSDVGPIALVPVPPMTTADAARYAERFVSIGAAIDGDRVKLITALDLWPSDTSLAREIEQSRSERTAIVLESPSLNPASIPIIRRCTTVVPVVQLGLSEEDEVGQLVAGTGRAPSTTMLCIEQPKRRRGLARLRRSKATAQV